MQEYERGVRRLLTALNNEITDENIGILAWILHYDIKQLKDDIEAIPTVEVTRKED